MKKIDVDGHNFQNLPLMKLFAWHKQQGDLCAECERMLEDLNEEWISDCFDRFFVAIGASEDFGGKGG